MKKLTQWLAATVLTGSVLAFIATAAESPSVLLQRGIYAEETEGNVDAAIKIYQQIAGEAAANRSVVAQAQYRLAVCYQKKGNKEQAISTLSSLLTQFPTETAVNEQTRRRLAELGAAPVEGVSIRKLLLRADAIYSVSRDGRHVVYRPPGKSEIAIFETLTGNSRIVVAVEKSPWSALVSPDGRQVVYDDGGSTAYVVNIDGSGTKQLDSILPEGGMNGIWLIDWLPTGQFLLGRWENTGSVLSTLDVRSGVKTDLPFTRFTGHRRGWLLSESGRYLAYHTIGAVWQRNMCILDLTSGSITTLTEKEVDKVVGWSPGDAKVFFTSESTGHASLWAIPIRDGKPAGDRELIKDYFGDISSRGVTRDGRLFYVEGTLGPNRAYIANVDFATGELTGHPRRVTERFPGRQTRPVWSADGRKLMLSIKTTEFEPTQHFVSIARETGEFAEFHLTSISPIWYHRYAWSEDSGFLLLPARQKTPSGEEQAGIYRYDLGSGRSQVLVANRRDELMAICPRLSADGRWFYYATQSPYSAWAKGNVSPSLIVRRDLQTGQEEVIYRSTERLMDVCPFEPSPDGTRLLIATMRSATPAALEDGEWSSDMRILTIGGTDSRELMRLGQREFSFWHAWTPNADSIICLKGELDKQWMEVGAVEVWAIRVISGERVRVKLPFAHVRQFAIHPDGRQFACAVEEPRSDRGVDLWVMDGMVQFGPRQRPTRN